MRYCLRNILLAIILTAPLPGNAQEPTVNPSKDRVLGKAGNIFITEDEFVRRFELLPGLYRRKGKGLEEEKVMEMYSLIAEKLLAQEAEAQGMGGDSAAIEGLDHLRDLLARDELYREEIAGKVRLGPNEIQQGLRNSVRKLSLRYLFFPNKEDAEFVASQLPGKDLRTFEVDSTISSMKDTVTIEWGKAEPEIEAAAYSLKKGEVSPVIESTKGFVILQLVSEAPDALYMGMQPSVRRERVMSHIRLVKEEARLREFLAGFLPGQTGYAVGPMIKKVAMAAGKELTAAEGDSLYSLPLAAKETLYKDLQQSLGDTFMVAGSRTFTVRNLIDMLVEKGFTCTSNRPLDVAAALNGQCRVWVQQELLAQEAVRRGMDRRQDVQSQMREWREAYLAQRMRAKVESGINVDDAEVYRYLQRYGDPLPTPRVQVRQLTTSSLEQMRQAMADLERGMPLAQVVQMFSRDPLERAKGGLSDYFPITDRPPVGELASQMAPGQLYGPVPTKDGVILFQLVARQDSVAKNSTLLERKKQTAEDLRRMLERDTVEKFIAGVAAKRGFSIFGDRLRALKVSPIPMMAFRVLGFGGRLFAAPMLPRLFGWVTKEVPKPSIVP